MKKTALPIAVFLNDVYLCKHICVHFFRFTFLKSDVMKKNRTFHKALIAVTLLMSVISFLYVNLHKSNEILDNTISLQNASSAEKIRVEPCEMSPVNWSSTVIHFTLKFMRVE